MQSDKFNAVQLRALRDERAWTQEELAGRASEYHPVSHGMISKLELGTRQPSNKTFRALYLALGVSRDDLLLPLEGAA
jgi:transcriptional regulator with XRE-family HTH domain